MAFLDRTIKTIHSKSILIDLAILFGRIPTDEEVADFMMQLISVLVDKNFSPDAVGYNSVEQVLTVTYRKFVEFAEVSQALEEALKEAKQGAEREYKRRKMGFGHIRAFDKDRFRDKPGNEE